MVCLDFCIETVNKLVKFLTAENNSQKLFRFEHKLFLWVSHNVQFYIVSTDSQPILGLTDCEKLGLVKRVNTIEVDELTKEVLRVKYKQVFQGLGNLGKYHITLKEGCTPVIRSPRCVPHSLKQRLKQALDANVKTGVLRKVDQPTSWVNNLVIVEKRNGSL